MVGSLFAASKVFGDLGDQLAKASTRTGVAVEELSELAFAADMSGADLETLETGLRKMAQTIVDASGGLQTARQALDQLGLTVAEAEIARINEEESRREQEINAQRDAVLQERERKRQRRRNQIEQERAGVEEELNRMQGDERRQREAARQAELAETERELEAARQDLRDALAEARRRREASEAGRPERMRRAGEFPDLDAMTKMAQKKADVQGTFSALAVRSLGATSLAERTAKATEQVAANTKKLLDKAKEGGLVFA